MASNSPMSQEPIISPLGTDPDFAELIVLFVDELKGQLTELDKAVTAADHQAVHRLAHAIKGAAGGYGYDVVTDAAKDLDELAKANARLDQLASCFAELKQLCARIQA